VVNRSWTPGTSRKLAQTGRFFQTRLSLALNQTGPAPFRCRIPAGSVPRRPEAASNVRDRGRIHVEGAVARTISLMPCCPQ
jgi:hypothetical protein